MFTLEDNLPFPALPIERVAPDKGKERMKKIGHSKAKVLFTLGFREREKEKEGEREREKERKRESEGERESAKSSHTVV